MSDVSRVQVLFPRDEADRFDGYCRDRGFKKSTLILRLVREHLDQQGWHPQRQLFEVPTGRSGRS